MTHSSLRAMSRALVALAVPTWLTLGPSTPVVAQAPPAAEPKPAPRTVPAPRRPIGCRATGSGYRLAGSRARRLVALTFDDGPSAYTPRVLEVLRTNRAHATFFVLGQLVRGREPLLRREIGDGNAIGNHTFNHANVAGGGGVRQMASTQGAIRRATGYTPCIFRPPYGAVSSLLVGQARRQAMATIGWDVDPRDWARPGAAAIQARVVTATHPGSIVVMHDGGGPRGQTIAALPGIIRVLRARGYRFVSVPELLRFAPRYGRSPNPLLSPSAFPAGPRAGGAQAGR